MQSLNFNAFQEFELHQKPFNWGYVDNVFGPSANAEAYIEAFPKDQFHEYRRDDGPKTLHVFGRSFVSLGEMPVSHLHGLDMMWVQLIKELDSPAFRQLLTQRLALDFETALLSASFWYYGKQHFFSPHTDRDTKLLTMVFYMNDVWEPEWGGNLLILDSNNVEDVCLSVAPIKNRCAMIIRSDASWHAVEAVVSEAALTRRSFVAHYFIPGTTVGNERPSARVSTS